MITLWQCRICPFETDDPHQAFLHRDKDPGPRPHHVIPVTIKPQTGIEKECQDQ